MSKQIKFFTNILGIIAVIIVISILIYFIALFGFNPPSNHTIEQAIEKGYAGYNSTTGFWEWK